MKILMTAHYYPPHVGGLEVVAQKHAEALVKAEHHVAIITAGEGSTKTVTEGGVKVLRLQALNVLDRVFGIPFPLFGPSLIGVTRREIVQADAVHIHDVFYMTSWVAYLFARWYKKPLFLTQHVATVEHPSTLVMWVQNIVYAVMGKRIFAYATRIVAYNRIVKDFLISRGVSEAKILEVRNGIDTKIFFPGSVSERNDLRKEFNLPENRPIALFVGRFVPKKGFNELIKAADSDFDLVLVGSGPVDVAKYKSNRVHFLGPQSRESLARIYRMADVFVCPSNGELFTLVMQEAMASGLPVVTTYDPLYREYDLDANLVVLCASRALDIQRAIKKVLQNDVLRIRMSAYSRYYAVEHFDWDKNFDEVSRLYAEVVQKEHSPLVVTTSWDDGHIDDLRLAKLLRKYDIKGTFYIAPQNREFPREQLLSVEALKTLSQEFEIGAHTVTHPHLTAVSEKEAEAEIRDSKSMLEAMLGKRVVSFCYPAGYFNESHTKMVERAGYKLARTVSRFSQSLSKPYELGTTIHAYRHWSDALDIVKAVGVSRFLRCYLNWDQLAMHLFDNAVLAGGVFHLWGHSWEIDASRDWDRLENVLRHIAHHDRVRYVTNGELV